MRATEPTDGLDTGGWPPLLRYAKAGELEKAHAELQSGADPNARAPRDDRTPLFWAAWEGHHRVVGRLLQHHRARREALADVKGLGQMPGAKRWPYSPLYAAHDRWGQNSDTFRAFGLLIIRKGR